MREFLRVLAFVALVVAQTPPVSAQVAPEAASEAQQLYSDGAELFGAHDYRGAAQKFQQAYNLDPSPILLYNLARAYEQLGDAGKSIEHYRQYLTVYPNAEDKAEVEKHISVLEAIQAASQRPNKLFIDELPAGATVHFNDAPAPAPDEDGSWSLVPGTYTIRVSVGAGQPWTTQAVIGMGEATRVRYTGAVPPAVTSEAPIRLALWGYVALGVGVVGGGLGVFYSLQSAKAEEDHNGLFKDLNAAGGAEPDNPDLGRLDTLRDDAELDATLANVAFGIAAASMLTGATLIAIDLLSVGAETPPGEPAASLVPYPGGFGLSGSF